MTFDLTSPTRGFKLRVKEDPMSRVEQLSIETKSQITNVDNLEQHYKSAIQSEIRNIEGLRDDINSKFEEVRGRVKEAIGMKENIEVLKENLQEKEIELEKSNRGEIEGLMSKIKKYESIIERYKEREKQSSVFNIYIYIYILYRNYDYE